MDDTNPYASPRSLTELGASRRTCWRIIPAAILMFFGGCMGIFPIVYFPAVFLGAAELRAEVISASLLCGVAGAVWIWSGRAIWNRKWRRGIIGGIIGYLIAGFAGCCLL